MKPATEPAFRKSTLPWLAVVLFAMTTLPACGATEPEISSADNAVSGYRLGRASRDGFGKFYMGREISHVMGHRGAAWLERPDRERDAETAHLRCNRGRNQRTAIPGRLRAYGSEG